MKIQSLSLAGFGSYQREVELDLSLVDVCAVTGSNGAGKSTLFDAVIWSLYGQVPGRTAAEIVNTAQGPAQVELVVTVNGEQHTFRRTRPAGDRQGNAYYKGPRGELSGAKVVTGQAEALLNASRESLALTALSRQGDSGRFGGMDPSQRRRALAEVVLGGFFDESRDKAIVALQRNQDKLARTEAEIELLVPQAEALNEAEAEARLAREESEDSETALAEAQEENDKASGLRERLKAAENAADAAERHARAERSYRQAAQNYETEAGRAKTREAELEDEIADTEDEIHEARADEEDAADAASRAKTVADEAAGSARDADDRLEQLQHCEEGECWVCGAALTEDHRLDLIADLEDLIRDAETSARSARKAASEAQQAKRALSGLESRLSKLMSDQEKANRDSVSLAQKADDSVASAEQAAEERLLALDACAEIDVLRDEASKIESVQRRLREAQSRHSDAQRRLGAAERRVTECEIAAERLPELRDETESLRDSVDGSELLKRSLAPTGLPHIALEYAMSGLAAAVNEALTDLGDLKIRFVLDDPTRSNPPLRIEALDTAAWHEWRSYATFSGGERMSMDIALRYGLTRLMQVNCRTVVLDEGWGALDDQSSQSLARLLLQLKESGKVDAIYTISHVASAVDWFPHRIEVQRGVHGSQAKVVSG